ncbi:MAG: PspC domain-containing protein [bacterium]|nr:PspC domain-containing protein [bacterium]
MNKKLYRSRIHRVISGVCGGLGEYFNIDPIVFRFVFIALLLAGGSSFFIYLIFLVVIPKVPFEFDTRESHSEQTRENSFDAFQQADLASNGTDDTNRTIFGLILISGGALLLLNNLVKAFNIEKLWPVVLVIIGLGLLFQKNKKNKDNIS